MSCSGLWREATAAREESDVSRGAPVRGYAPAAVWYCSTTLAGTRPRSLTSMPRSLAHSRTLAVSTAALPRRARAALLVVPPVRLACARYCCSALRARHCARR
jgi:hypothetical protein